MSACSTSKPDASVGQISCANVGRRSSCRLATKKFSALRLLGKRQTELEIQKDIMDPTTKKYDTIAESCDVLIRKNSKRSNLLVSSLETKLQIYMPDGCVEGPKTICYRSEKGNSFGSSIVSVDSECMKDSLDVNAIDDSSAPNPEHRNLGWNDYDRSQASPQTELQLLVSSENYVDNSFQRTRKPDELEDLHIIIEQSSEMNKYPSQLTCKEDSEGISSFDLQQTLKMIAEGENVSGAEDLASVKIVENESSRHMCKFCGKTFEKRPYLARHIKGHLYIYQCRKCTKKFSRAESLTSHNCQEFVGAAAKAYSCQQCGSKFNSKKYMLRHLVAHTEDFKCGECRRSFARRESLLQHSARCHPTALDHGKPAAYPCSQCKKVYAKELSLQNHMKLHSDSFKCPACAKPFSSAFSLARHSCVGDVNAGGIAHEMEDGCFECKKCGKVLSQRVALKRHLATHEYSFLCTVCGRKCSRKDELKKHTLECAANAEFKESGFVKCNICHQQFLTPVEFIQHHKEHTHPYKCDLCGQYFLRQVNRDDHHCTALEDQQIECKTCKKRFPSAQHLKRHAAVHAERKHICDHCGRRFNRIDYLYDHICLDDDGKQVRIRRTKHSEEVIRGQRAVVCSVCGKNYASISNLNKHLKTHGEKKEICEVCGKQFHLMVLLKEHIKFVHTDMYSVECPHCSKRMKSRNSLYGHIALFHPELSRKAVTNHKCDQCDRVFRQKGNLKKHKLTHSDKHTYKCKECCKTFKFPEQMRRHELWHKHGARHRCHLCDRRFVMKFELRKHTETLHGGVQFVCKYCSVVCHHHQAMKRHLQRCHFNITEWQVDTTDFIKSLQVFRDSYKNIKEAPVLLPEIEQPQVGNVVTALPEGQLAVTAVRSHRIFPAPAAESASLPGTVVLSNVSKVNQNCITDGQLLQNSTAFCPKTAPEITEFNPTYIVATNTAETMTALCGASPALGENPACLLQTTKLAYSEGMIQIPVSVTEGSTVSMGSEYFFLSYNTAV